MRKLLKLTPALAALLATMPLHADDQADFAARYAALKAAYDDRDDKEIKALLTKDFVATDIQGDTRDADDMITALAMIPVDPENKSETKINSVAVDGTTAKVVQTRTMSMHRQGRDGTMHQGEFITLSNDTWVQQGGKWLLKASEAQEVTIKRDGVEMRHFHKGDPIPPRGQGRFGGPRGEGQPGQPPAPPPPGN